MLKLSHQNIGGKLKVLRREAEERDAGRRAKEEKTPYLDLRGQAISVAALELVPENLAREAKAVAFSVSKNKIKLAAYTTQTSEFGKLTLFLEEKKLEPQVFVASLSSIEEAWQHYASVRVEDRGEIVSEIRLSEGLVQAKVNIKTVGSAAEDIGSLDDEASTTEILTTVLADALALAASDVHLEAGRDRGSVRYRLDGILHETAKLPLDVHSRLVGRVKLLAKLKLNIKDQAQDGRFTIKRSKSDVEVRVSVVPAEFGESVVMRLLDPEVAALDLSDLGMRRDDEAIAVEAIRRPNGMVLNTGPTGSGKTTSLYAFLKQNNSPQVKIITIEDPIEYHLGGVEQTQVSPRDGYTFASGLRSILRQDPDIILVGEIRDAETAKTAINAALTGHLVFSTLHTNSATGAIPRLIDLKVRPSSLVPALNLVIAQRLVRRLCERCKKPLPPSGDQSGKIKAFYAQLPERVAARPPAGRLYQNVGCPECVDGFKGRIGIFEVLVFDDSFEPLLGAQVSEAKIKAQARSKGMVYMQEDGILKALAGVTTLDEVERITGSIKWPLPAVE